MKTVVPILGLVCLVTSAPAPAADHSVVANLALCVPADLMTVARFAADWRHWGGYIDICPVLSWSGDRALYILTVRVDRAQIQVDATIERLMAIPHARLLSPDGRLLGELPSAFAGGLPEVMIGIALWGLQAGLTAGLFSTQVADTSPTELRGTAYGLFNLANGAALLVASLAAGGLWDRLGPGATFGMGAGLALIALCGLLAVGRLVPWLAQPIRR